MSEYWVSQKRYFCKYCKIYVADEVNQRRQHDEGLRHKGNIDRYIKDLYKRGAQQNRDKEDEARELQKIEKAAHAAMGSTLPMSAALAAPAAKRLRPATSAGPILEHYSSAASLGLAPLQGEKTWTPGQRRQDVGVAGEWQAVGSTAGHLGSTEVSQSDTFPHTARYTVERASGIDREIPLHPSLSEKTAAFHNDLYDPGPIRLKRASADLRSVKEEDDGPPGVAAAAHQPRVRPIRFTSKPSSPPKIDRQADLQVFDDEQNVSCPDMVPSERNAPVMDPESSETPVTATLFKKRKQRMR